MEYDREGTSSAAKRRRERRLRAAWRHEQLSVRMALAAAQHHSAPKCAGPETHEAHRDRRQPGQLGSGARLWRRCPDRRRWRSRSVTWLPPGLFLSPRRRSRMRATPSMPPRLSSSFGLPSRSRSRLRGRSRGRVGSKEKRRLRRRRRRRRRRSRLLLSGEGKRGSRRSSRRPGDHFFLRFWFVAAVPRQGRLRRGARGS